MVEMSLTATHLAEAIDREDVLKALLKEALKAEHTPFGSTESEPALQYTPLREKICKALKCEDPWKDKEWKR